MAKSILDGLNPEQLEAVRTTEGPVLVLAGAGTGKTRVITARIAYMIEQGIDPASILGVTFTNKAAKEMRERIRKIVPAEAAAAVTLGTFHSFCARVLRRDIRYAGNYDSNYSIADTADQTSIARQAAAELGYAKDEIPTAEAVNFIGHCKNRMWTPEDALNDAAENRPANQVLAEVYERYQKLLELQNMVDFDDMLLLTVRILEEHPDVLKRYRETYKYLLVDEYQDTNAAQFRLIQLLAGERKNLCVVGDDDQSIYAWRGADVSNILDFPRYFPGTKEVKLEQNYRSTNNILATANAVIAPNSARYCKNLWSSKGQGEIIRIIRLDNGDAEAKFVVNAIFDLKAANPDYNYSDFAILYRSNYLSRAFEMAFRNVGIRPKIIGGQEFFQRKEVKDAAAYLKLILNPRDDQSLLRIISLPPRGIGDKAILSLRNLRHVTGIPLSELLDHPDYLKTVSSTAAAGARGLAAALKNAKALFAEPGDLYFKAQQLLRETGYIDGLQRIYKDIKEAETRRENVFEFLNYIGKFESEKQGQCHLADFLESYSLMDDNDRTEDDDDRDAPIMTTVHASKGLEFPVVFVVGMEQNLFPHERSLAEGSVEEERRLFYVAVTRAREQLLLTCARERYKFKEYVRQIPSHFLKDVPEDISENQAGNSFLKVADEASQIAMFEDLMRQLSDDED
ncbi:MAG: UvrD-helicase domain-containing protein [Lentisphaeria bacterium]|nr:UvrD-helicase domain-containing protein [Lentisphaeria bacterium]MBR4884629.1 UvrD-helicase domain-containing protein [Lentisphaeria bacterium]